MPIEKKLTCTTCAGDLVLDKERMLYKCPFCGVAYGYALFDGSALDKAAKALALGEFNDADLYFSFALAMDPKDIRAYRGRVFCAGKWKKTEDITHTRKDVTGIRAQNVNKRCDEAIKNLTPEQGKYFKYIKETLQFTDRYNDALPKFRRLNDRREDLLEQIDRINAVIDEYLKEERARRRRNYGLRDLINDIRGESYDEFSGPVPPEIESARDMLSISYDSLKEVNLEYYASNTEIQNLKNGITSRRNRLLELDQELFPAET